MSFNPKFQNISPSISKEDNIKPSEKFKETLKYSETDNIIEEFKSYLESDTIPQDLLIDEIHELRYNLKRANFIIKEMAPLIKHNSKVYSRASEYIQD